MEALTPEQKSQLEVTQVSEKIQLKHIAHVGELSTIVVLIPFRI